MKRSAFKLEQDEQAIENAFEKLVPVPEAERAKLARALKTATWKKAVTMRLSNAVIDALKQRAALDGIPYQTLASMILQKYVRGALLEKDAVKEVVKALG